MIQFTNSLYRNWVNSPQLPQFPDFKCNLLHYPCQWTMTTERSRTVDKIQINFEVRDYLNWIWGGSLLSASGVVWYLSILSKCQSYRSGGGYKVDLTNQEILFMPAQSNSQIPDSCSCLGPWQWHWSMTQRDVYARECCLCNTTPDIPQEKVIGARSVRGRSLGRFKSNPAPCLSANSGKWRQTRP